MDKKFKIDEKKAILLVYFLLAMIALGLVLAGVVPPAKQVIKYEGVEVAGNYCDILLKLNYTNRKATYEGITVYQVGYGANTSYPIFATIAPRILGGYYLTIVRCDYASFPILCTIKQDNKELYRITITRYDLVHMFTYTGEAPVYVECGPVS